MPMTANGIVGCSERERSRETAVGERGELTPDGDEVGEPEQVAQRDPQKLAALRPA